RRSQLWVLVLDDLRCSMWAIKRLERITVRRAERALQTLDKLCILPTRGVTELPPRPLLARRVISLPRGNPVAVRRQHVLDRISGVRKGGFLAHRSQSRSEDETEIRDGKDALRTNHQRHSAGDAEALFG